MPKVELVGFFHLGHVEFHTQAGLLGHLHVAAFNAQRLFGQALTVLPDPVGVDGGDLAWRGGADMGEHGQ